MAQHRKLTDAQLVAKQIPGIWDQIAGDMGDSEVCTYSSAEVTELCCDADRLATFGNDASANSALDRLIETHGNTWVEVVAAELPFQRYEA